MNHLDELCISSYTDEMLFDLIENNTPKKNSNNAIIFKKDIITRPWTSIANKKSTIPKINQDQTVKIQSKCRNCDENSEIQVIDGKIICVKCGLVLSIKIDNHAENRMFSKEDGTCSNNVGYTLRSTSLLPTYNNTNVIGNNSFNLMNKLNMWNNALSPDEKNIMKAYKQIKEICQKANFSKKIEDSAKSLYINLKKCTMNIFNEKVKHGINREDKQRAIVAICILKACNLNGNARNKYDIANICGINIKQMTKADKTYSDIIQRSEISVNTLQTSSHELIQTLCRDLMITEQYQELAIKISKNIEKLYICSNSTPQSVAAATILLIIVGYKLPITVEKLAIISYISASTIEKCYKKIKPYVSIITSTERTDALVNDISKIIDKIEIPSEFNKLCEQADLI